MKKFKVMLSLLLSVIVVVMSIISPTAIVAPEDSFLVQAQCMQKIDDVLVEKMAESSDINLIPVWVWMTDIDMEQLDKDIETRTGISQQKLDTARAQIGYDVSTISSNVETLRITDANAQKTVSTYLEATKVQRKKIANDTEIYLATKKALASQRYATANTTKIRQLGVSDSRIDFQSELTPSFVAYLTKDEIVEMARENNVVNMGYFSEYDEESTQEPTTVCSQIDSTESSDVASTSHLDVKQVIQHDDALEKYNVTGDGVTVLHIDGSYVHKNFELFDKIYNSDNIYNFIDGITFSPLDTIPSIAKCNAGSHANNCISYLQSFAKDVNVFVVGKNVMYENYSNLPIDDPNRINTFDDIETLIQTQNIDIINSSANEGHFSYEQSFSARWFDAIVNRYNITMIASADNKSNITHYVTDHSSGYNSIAVGVYEYDTNNMASLYRYNAIEDQSRVSYKPDLVVAMDEENGSFGATSSGSPIVSAIVAMMMELDTSLKGCPEIIKAILMASCHEKANPSIEDQAVGYEEYMEEGLTLKQGAGKVNTLRALDIVAYGTYGQSTIYAEQNGNVIDTINLNSEVETDDVKYPLNVSVAWLRGNRQELNDQGDYEVELGDYYDLCMSVYHSGQPLDNRKASETQNSGKQLVYISEPEWDKNYNIRVYWRSNNTEDREEVNIGYAYSVGDFEKVLEKVELTGTVAVGKTLTANAYTNDGMLAETGALYYEWYSSTDGNDWQRITGALSPTYTLTVSDLNKYFKCLVVQDYLSNHEIEEVTLTSVVRFGDVDNDGAVSTVDATKIQLYMRGFTTLTSAQLVAADVNGDGNVDDTDVTLIQQYLSEDISKFPVED